jgi:uncharacterized membrane protein
MDNNGFNEYTPQNDPFTPAPPQTERPYYRARDFRAAARKALQGFWIMAIVVTFVAGLLGGITQGGFSPSTNVNYEIDSTELDSIPGADESALVDYIHWMESVNDRYPALKAFIAFASVLSAIQLIIGGPITLGFNRFKLRRLDGEEAKFGDLFSCFDRFLDGLWMRIRTILQVFLWALLLIIPGIVAAYRYALIPYLMADHPDMSVGEAFEKSKALMNGRKWDLFCLDLSFIGWWILCGFTFGILSLWITPYSQMARTSFYRSLCPAPAAEPETDYEW